VKNDTRFVFIDGLACPDLDHCYAALEKQLSFPEYFGNNLDALDEMLADLDWIKESTVKIILLNKDALLSKEPAKKKAFLEILQSAESKKVELIFLD
jgi:RNAse (barnase) inhibitor barstar